jgi:hypothetical protein
MEIFIKYGNWNIWFRQLVWISQNKLKVIVKQAIISANNAFMEESSCQLRIFQIEIKFQKLQ